MAKRKYSKKKNVVKTMSKRKRSGPIFRVPFTEKRFVTFKYRDFQNLSVGTNLAATQVYRINSCYDPDLTGIGKQPRYWDQLANSNLYQLYLVHSVTYKVTFINKSASNDAIVSVKLRDVATSASSAEEHYLSSELPKVHLKTLLPLGQSTSRVTIKGKSDIWPLLSNSKASYFTSRSAYQSGWNASPADQAYMVITATDNPQGAAGCDVDMFVDIYYHVELFDNAMNQVSS